MIINYSGHKFSLSDEELGEKLRLWDRYDVEFWSIGWIGWLKKVDSPSCLLPLFERHV